jgi:uncharacterized protein
MRNYFKFFSYLVVAACFSSAIAGSYEDFFVALKRDDAAAVRTLLQRGFDPNTRNPEGLDSVYLAVRDGSMKSAEVLVAWPKTQVDRRSPKDETALMIASLKGDLNLARKLVARGADVVKTGWTPLHYAATNGHIPVIEFLLEQHAYIDAESPNGTTPLMMAAQYGSPAAAKFLLEAGADPTLKNQLGLTAADFALQVNRQDLAQVFVAASKAWREKYRQR